MINKNHTHIYDDSGKQICCSLEEKIDRKSPPPPLVKNKHREDDGHNHCTRPFTSETKAIGRSIYLPLSASFYSFQVLP